MCVKIIYGANRAGALLFESWPNSFLAKFDGTCSIERSDVDLVNEGIIPKKPGRVYKMVNKSRCLLADLCTIVIMCIYLWVT